LAERNDAILTNFVNNLNNFVDLALEANKDSLKALLDMLMGTDPATNPFIGKEKVALENLKTGLKFLLDSFLYDNKAYLQFLQDYLLGNTSRSA
jgi:hypothetical protein